MSVRSPQSSPGTALARLLLAATLTVHGGWRLWAAYQGVPTSGATLSFSAAALVLGVLVAAGWRLRATAMLAAVLAAAVAALSHPFWAVGGGARGAYLLQFAKDVGLAGGFLLLGLTATAARRR